MAETSEPRRIPLRDGWVDLDRRLVVRGERQVVLSPTEARLLGWMAARPGQLFSRATLLEHVWGYNPNVSSRTTDITMHRLRLKIEAYPDNPDHLITEHSKGYRFAPAAVYGALPLKVTLARSNLQPETNRFVGREADLNDIAGRL